jgi:hypothetical protein
VGIQGIGLDWRGEYAKMERKRKKKCSGEIRTFYSKRASKQTRNELGRAKFKNGGDRAPPWFGRTLVGLVDLYYFSRPNKS